MTNFHIMTLFPEMCDAVLRTSIIGRAIENGVIGLNTYQIRDFSADEKHHKVDDYTYGGGAGMLMAAQPIYDCYEHIRGTIASGNLCTIYLTPQGRLFTQETAKTLAGYDDLILLCGHYEGVDERVLEEMDCERISIGDYVLTGGEIPAMVVTDAVARMIPGVLSNEESAETESFDDGLLEYPQYTRPEHWMGRAVPEILLSGDHAKVDAWRKEQSVLRTRQMRPDLYEAYLRTQGTSGGAEMI